VAGTCGYGEGLSGCINAGNFLTSCKVYWLASQEGLCSVEYVSKPFLKFLYIAIACSIELMLLAVRTWRRSCCMITAFRVSRLLDRCGFKEHCNDAAAGASVLRYQH